MKRVANKVIVSCVDFSSYYKFFTYDKTHRKLATPNELLILFKEKFSYVRLFKTSGLFHVPSPLNMFLSKYFPNQIILLGFSWQKEI